MATRHTCESRHGLRVLNPGLDDLLSVLFATCGCSTDTAVGDAGLTNLPVDLKWLVLTDTKVTDAGPVAISRLTKLENLNLSNDSISDAGLARLEGLTNLKTLVIVNTQVTKAGAAKLNKKLPTLKIHR